MIRVAIPNTTINKVTVTEYHKEGYFFVYTENTHSLQHAPNRVGGGQAQIRGLKGVLPICTKKVYIYKEDRHKFQGVNPNQEFKELKDFQDVNIPLLNKIEDMSRLGGKVILPRQFGGSLAFMPKPCAKWLCARLNKLIGEYTYTVVTTERGSHVRVDNQLEINF